VSINTPQPTEGRTIAHATGVGRVASRGAALTVASQVAKIGLTFVTTIVVARLLSAEQYGVVAMVSPVTGFLLLFQNLGLGQAALQSRELTSEQSNAMFWLNMVASFVVALLMLALSPGVWWFYDDPRPAYVMAASGIIVMLSGLQLQHIALLNRDMRFGAISRNEILTAAVTAAATIILALVLRNYWALWGGAAVGAIISTSAIWLSSAWRPRWGFDLKGTRKLIAVGADVTGFNVVNFFARNADNVLIARVWGSEAVGLYDRSYKLMLLPLQNFNWPLGRVVVPSLLRLRDDPARYRVAFLRIIRAISLATVPGVAAAAIASREVVVMLLGEKWTAAGPIFFWLSLAGVTQPMTSALGWLFLTSDRSRAMLYWGMFGSTVTLVSFFVGISDGAVGVARAYFVGQTVLIPPLIFVCTRSTSVSASSLCAVMLPTPLAGVGAWLLIEQWRGEIGLVPFLALAVIACYTFAIVAHAATRDGRATLVAMLRHGWSVLPKRER
jgi:PST family polysaccharide transporter